MRMQPKSRRTKSAFHFVCLTDWVTDWNGENHKMCVCVYVCASSRYIVLANDLSRSFWSKAITIRFQFSMRTYEPTTTTTTTITAIINDNNELILTAMKLITISLHFISFHVDRVCTALDFHLVAHQIMEPIVWHLDVCLALVARTPMHIKWDQWQWQHRSAIHMKRAGWERRMHLFRMQIGPHCAFAWIESVNKINWNATFSFNFMRTKNVFNLIEDFIWLHTVRSLAIAFNWSPDEIKNRAFHFQLHIIGSAGRRSKTKKQVKFASIHAASMLCIHSSSARA